VRLSTELRTLRFGEHVAENEVDILSEYFLPTAAFDDVISERNTLFIGRKGTGKTANMYQAAARLAEDVRNLVVVIKPASYEFSSLLSILPSLSPSLQQYSIEALWKFLLQSEIANTVLRVIESRVPGIPFTDDEKKLIDFVERNQFGLRDEFAVRFERTVSAIADLQLSASTSEASGRDHLKRLSILTPSLSFVRCLVLFSRGDGAWLFSSTISTKDGNGARTCRSWPGCFLDYCRQSGV
jgi:hypothetical protein